MTTFFLDLWQDLREKRLWPVAVALLLATAAVPVLLFKPAGTHSSSGTPNTSGKGLGALPVVTMADTAGHVSKLDAFSKKNPFKPLNDMPKTAANPTAGSPTPTGSSGGASGSSASGGGAGGSHGGGGSTPGGGVSTGGTPTGPVTTSHTTYFAFHVDVKFGPTGKEKTYKDISQLGMVPDDKSPVAVFMGMTADAKKAVFMIDGTKLSADGEGTCKPSPSNCTFLELGVSDSTNEETLAATDGSTEYTIKLLHINQVPLTADQAKGGSSKSKPTSGAQKRKAKKAKAARHERHNPLYHLFELPSFMTQG
jgi:hypothetical protein